MKKVIVLTMMVVLIASSVFAVDMEGVDVRAKALNKIEAMRSSALQLSTRLSTLKTAIQGYLADYEDSFEASDRTKMVAVNVDLTACTSACDTLAAEVLTQFPSTNE